MYRFRAGESIEIEPFDDGLAVGILVALDYLAAPYLPDWPPGWFYCSVSDGLSMYSMERAGVHEQEVGGETVTPILTIRARGGSGTLECHDEIGSSDEPLRAVVFSPED